MWWSDPTGDMRFRHPADACCDLVTRQWPYMQHCCENQLILPRHFARDWDAEFSWWLEAHRVHDSGLFVPRLMEQGRLQLSFLVQLRSLRGVGCGRLLFTDSYQLL